MCAWDLCESVYYLIRFIFLNLMYMGVVLWKCLPLRLHAVVIMGYFGTVLAFRLLYAYYFKYVPYCPIADARNYTYNVIYVSTFAMWLFIASCLVYRNKAVFLRLYSLIGVTIFVIYLGLSVEKFISHTNEICRVCQTRFHQEWCGITRKLFYISTGLIAFGVLALFNCTWRKHWRFYFTLMEFADTELSEYTMLEIVELIEKANQKEAAQNQAAQNQAAQNEADENEHYLRPSTPPNLSEKRRNERNRVPDDIIPNQPTPGPSTFFPTQSPHAIVNMEPKSLTDEGRKKLDEFKAKSSLQRKKHKTSSETGDEIVDCPLPRNVNNPPPENLDNSPPGDVDRPQPRRSKRKRRSAVTHL